MNDDLKWDTERDCVFQLYAAGGAPNSSLALANLHRLCRKHLPDMHRIEFIDALKEPLRALADAILVLPTTVKIAPTPTLQIIGDLSDEEQAIHVLGWSARESYTKAAAPSLSNRDGHTDKALALALSLAHAESRLNAFTAGQTDAIIDSNGQPYLLRAAQEELFINEGQLRAIDELTTDVIIIVDCEGVILFYNRAARKAIADEGEDILGKNVFNFIQKDDLPTVYGAFRNVVEKLIDQATIQFRHRVSGGCGLISGLIKSAQWREFPNVIFSLRPISTSAPTSLEAVRKESSTAQMEAQLNLRALELGVRPTFLAGRGG